MGVEERRLGGGGSEKRGWGDGGAVVSGLGGGRVEVREEEQGRPWGWGWRVFWDCPLPHFYLPDPVS